MHKRILSIDYGERRIGLALSDPMHILATPLDTLDTRTTPDSVEAIASVVEENEVGLIVIGYPFHLDGRISEKALAVDAYIKRLAKRLPGMEIEKTDERYSSVEAHDLLRQRKRKRRGDKQTVDRIAAAVILQDYLNEHPGL